VIDPRPRAFIDQEVVQPRLAFRRPVANQIEQHRLVPIPDLPEEQRVDDLRCFDELRQHKAIRLGKAGQIHSEIGWRESVGHPLEL
jgi:hypothetical protein